MTHTTRGLAAAFLIAAGLFTGSAAAQTREQPAPTGCTGDGNCGSAPRVQIGR